MHQSLLLLKTMRTIAVILFELLLLCISLHQIITSAAADEAPYSASFEMIPNGEQRVINEGTFNITCRFSVSSVTDIGNLCSCEITWDLPAIYKENKLTVIL